MVAEQQNLCSSPNNSLYFIHCQVKNPSCAITTKPKINELIFNLKMMLPNRRDSSRGSLGRVLKQARLISGCVVWEALTERWMLWETIRNGNSFLIPLPCHTSLFKSRAAPFQIIPAVIRCCLSLRGGEWVELILNMCYNVRLIPLLAPFIVNSLRGRALSYLLPTEEDGQDSFK